MRVTPPRGGADLQKKTVAAHLTTDDTIGDLLGVAGPSYVPLRRLILAIRGGRGMP